MGFSGTPKDMGPPYGTLPILFPNPTPMFESLKIWVHGMGPASHFRGSHVLGGPWNHPWLEQPLGSISTNLRWYCTWTISPRKSLTLSITTATTTTTTTRIALSNYDMFLFLTKFLTIQVLQTFWIPKKNRGHFFFISGHGKFSQIAELLGWPVSIMGI